MANGQWTKCTDTEDSLFLSKLTECGNVTRACRAANVARSTVNRRRQVDPEFAAKWMEALDEAGDDLELEARRRAVEGVERSIIRNGEVVATVREYSDRLLAILLKAAKPEKYGERTVKHQLEGQINVQVNSLYKRMIEQMMKECAEKGVAITRAEAIDQAAEFMAEIRRHLQASDSAPGSTPATGDSEF